MSGQWQYSANDSLERARSTLAGVWQALAQPERARRLRQIVALILVVWAVFSVVELIWAFLPHPDPIAPPESAILNPMESRSGAVAAEPVDIDAMLSWHLFGVAGEAAPAATAVVEAETVDDREGIEKGARETRLDLKLRGVVAASQDGLGHAIIEHRSKQDVYAVGDKLPTGGRVTLAKVMSGGVVLDNNGTYELLRLFEETSLLGQLPPDTLAKRSAATNKNREKPAQQAQTAGEDVAVMASNFRQQLYENPQSLAEVVRVSAVRENNTLMGYRVDPGKNSAQFTQLGFKAGDVVTRVNGIELDNPGNTVQLYQLMRSASEAVFDLQRGGENVTLTVNLDAAAPGGG